VWDNIVRTLLLISLTGVAVYAVLIAYVCLFQSRLIYFPNIPSRALTVMPTEIGLDFEEVRITTADRIELHGWYVAAGAGAPTVLFCHGNAGNISHRLDWLEIFHDMGLAVFLFDYRGYGQSSGTPDEKGTYLDAQAVWDYLTNTKRHSPKSVVIFGESLGGPIAANLAKDVSPGALVLASTFTSVPDLASNFYWFLPVRLLARFHYPTAEYTARVHVPTLVIHSRTDEIVPFSHAEAIFRRANERKQLLEIRGDHNSALLVSRQQITEGMRRFLEAMLADE
jgi:fermentation-respiration switch protein FrsA (DUF1100 family)